MLKTQPPKHKAWLAPISLTMVIALSACTDNSETPVTEDVAEVKASAEQTPAAELESGVMLSNIKQEIRPQDDLYHFVNGKWLDTAEIPSDRSSYGNFQILREKSEISVRKILTKLQNQDPNTLSGEAQKVKALYESFLDEDSIKHAGINPYESATKDIDKLSDKAELASFLATPWVISELGPIGFFIAADKKEPTKYAPYLYQSGLSLPDRDYYFDDSEKGLSIIEDYKLHVENMMALVGNKTPKESALTIFEFERTVAEGQWMRVDMRDAVKTYNPVDPADISTAYPDFYWQEFLTTAQFNAEKKIVIGQPSYMEHLIKLFNDASLADWKLYLKWRALHELSPLLTEEIVTENFNFFNKTLRGVKEQRDRWKRAIQFSSEYAGEALGKIYVDEYFPPEAKERMVALVENLREAYRESILDLEWMSETTKKRAIDKLEKFLPKIGYPDVWRDYSELEVSDQLADNFIAGINFQYQQQINKLGNPIDRTEWLLTPQTVNAYYHPLLNEIVFPAAILQPPFFNLAADDAVNYGAIGGVIGHEMGHGFDDQGSRYNGDGKLDNWWEPEDGAAFAERTKALVEQYNNYTALDGLNVNGELTLGENIGDLGGLTIAHKAYLLSLDGKEPEVIDGFTGEQRFFIGWAQAFSSKYTDENLRLRVKTDPHSPAQFRVNGVVKNMPQFHAAFDVKEDDKLYLSPAEQVKIW